MACVAGCQSKTIVRGNIYNGGLLGGGIRGFIPNALVDSDQYALYAQNRFYIREVYNTNSTRQVSNQGIPAKINSPFRLLMNAGDPLSRKYYSCGGPCQTFQFRPQIHGLKQKFGHIQDLCDSSGIEASSCNTKYVYDSSDYTSYRKKQAIAKNYNILSNGNNDFSAQQVAYRAIRRF